MQNIKTKVFNSKFLSDNVAKEDYEANRTIVIQSSTGTGKTHTIFKHMIKKDLKDNSKTLLSISGKQSLIKTHLNYFKKNYETFETNHYEINKKTFTENVGKFNSFVCINSLLNVSNCRDDSDMEYFIEILKNKIVFVDEISIFVSELINNSTITNLQDIYYILGVIFTYAYKVIVCESEISESVFELLRCRIEDYQQEENNQTLYIVNKYKKSSNCTIMNDINNFIDKMIQSYANGEYFLCACDSRKMAKKLYCLFLKRINEEDAKKTFIFVSDTDKITDTFDFEHTYTFYSPSIICGCDFSVNYPQNQFLYSKGKSVSANLLYQMANRTRNQKMLYIHFDKKYKEENLKYESLEDCYDKILLQKNEILKAFSLEGKNSAIATSFFTLYCKEEYHLDAYKQKKKTSLIKILKKDGFKIHYQDATEGYIYDKELEEVKGPKNILNQMSNDAFEEWMNGKPNEFFDEKKRLLCLDDEDLIKFKGILKDEQELETHFKICGILCKKDYVEKGLLTLRTKTFDEKLIGEYKCKLLFLKQLETLFNINIFSDSEFVEYEEKPIELTQTIKDGIKNVLKSRRDINEIKTTYDIVKLITSEYQKITRCDLFCNKKRKEGIIKYRIKYDFLNSHMELLYKRTHNFDKFEENIRRLLGVGFDWEEIIGENGVIKGSWVFVKNEENKK